MKTKVFFKNGVEVTIICDDVARLWHIVTFKNNQTHLEDLIFNTEESAIRWTQNYIDNKFK